MTVRIHCDFETRSRADLKKTGSAKYAADSSTEILCLAFAVGDGSVRLWRPGDPAPVFADDAVLVAHNAFFELMIWRHVGEAAGLGACPPIERWDCTAAKAARFSLPRTLDGACKALGLKHQKDQAGDMLIRRLSQPGPDGSFNNDPELLHHMALYCMADVEAERALDQFLPNVGPGERRVWLVDQKINARGFAVDTEFVDIAQRLIETELARHAVRIERFGIDSLNAGQQIIKFCERRHVQLADCRKETVAAALAHDDLPSDVREVLEIRQAAGGAAVKKYAAAGSRVQGDGRIRDGFLYAGAHTWRWSGRGFQPQNLPRGSLGAKNEHAIGFVKSGQVVLAEDLYDLPCLNLLADCLRGVIVAAPGKTLIAGDYSKVEAIALACMAGQQDLIAAFTAGRDVYKDMAGRIYGVPADQVTPAQRQLGKATILGCGYGMGHVKFQATCATQYGVTVSLEQAKVVVDTYRGSYWAIKAFWKFLEGEAKRAITTPNQPFSSNQYPGFTFQHVKRRHAKVEGATLDFLMIRIPSGRHLFYPQPWLKPAFFPSPPWPPNTPTEEIHFMEPAPNQKDMRDAKTYSGKLAENVTQAICRDLMALAMVRLEAAGYPVVVHSHDEIVAEVDKADVKEFEMLMIKRPPWAATWPITADCWTHDRYRKA